MSLLGNPLVRSSFPVDYFTGDGTTATFVLSETAPSVNAMEVFVDGAHIAPADYIVSNKNLTFSVAPANDAAIVVRQLGIRGTVGVPAADTVIPSSLSSGHPSWDISGNLTIPGDLIVTGGDITGNASTATKFATSHTINGVAFDGSANISVGVTEAQVADGSLLARLAANETITGSWTFDAPITSVEPISGSNLATKNYVDTFSTGLVEAACQSCVDC